MKKQKEFKHNMLTTYKSLWKIMSRKDKVLFCFLTFLVLFRCFAVISTTQILACLVDVFAGKTGHIWGIPLPEHWTPIQVVIFTHALIMFIWLFCDILVNFLRKYSISIACKVNEKVLNIINKPRENLDFNMTNGEAVFIANSVGESVFYLIKDFWLKILVPIFSCIVSLIFIAQIDLVSFAIFFACFVFIFTSSLVRLKFESKHQNNIEKAKSKINNLYLNNIENISLITMLNSQEVEKEYLKKFNDDYRKQWAKVTNLATKYWTVAYLIQYVLIASGIIVCMLRQGMDVANLSNIVALVSYSAQLCTPLENIGIELGQLQIKAVQFNRIHLLVGKDLQAEELIAKNLSKAEKIEKIEIENLKVSVGNFEKVYDNIKFETNSINVISGDSGSGKSILIGTMLGLRTHDEGDIVINGKYRQSSLYPCKERISLISQNAMIFDRPIVDNIAYPENKLNRRMKKYVKIFNLEHLLERNRDDLNVMKTLSGGEQKRIGLVRGMSKKADVYIFDEPSNDLDNENVDLVIREIQKLKEKAMIIVISHDKRLMNVADNLIKIE